MAGMRKGLRDSTLTGEQVRGGRHVGKGWRPKLSVGIGVTVSAGGLFAFFYPDPRARAQSPGERYGRLRPSIPATRGSNGRPGAELVQYGQKRRM